MSKMVIGCTALVGLNKCGVLKPDADGYFTVVLGALDFRNSVGEIYTQHSARAIFEQSSAFMRRMKSGYCRGEYGHPKKENMTNEQFLMRVMTIEETKVCMHISEVWIDTDSIKYRGERVVAIMGKIRPSGPYGEILKDQLLNGKENVAFSVRSITDNYYKAGITHKDFAEICGWDYVIEPGLAPANKYAAPGLESHVVGEVNDTCVLTSTNIQAAIRNAADEAKCGLSMESVAILGKLQKLVAKKLSITDRKVAPSAAW